MHGALVLHKAIEHITRKTEVHPALPIIERAVLGKAALDQFLGWHVQVKNCIGLERDAIQISQPGLVHTTHHVARHQGINIAIGQDDEPGFQRGQDDIFELVRKIGRVEQAQSRAAENIAFLGLLEFLADEGRALQADLDGCMTAAFEPFDEHRDLRRASGTIRALDNN